MFTLTKLSNGQYKVHCGDFFLTANKTLAKHALRSLGVKAAERKMALQEMDAKDHAVAEFGVLGRFIYTRCS